MLLDSTFPFLTAREAQLPVMQRLHALVQRIVSGRFLELLRMVRRQACVMREKTSPEGAAVSLGVRRIVASGATAFWSCCEWRCTDLPTLLLDTNPAASRISPRTCLSIFYVTPHSGLPQVTSGCSDLPMRLPNASRVQSMQEQL